MSGAVRAGSPAPSDGELIGDNGCQICFAHVANEERVYCEGKKIRHLFHRACLTEWAQRRQNGGDLTCTYCNEKITDAEVLRVDRHQQRVFNQMPMRRMPVEGFLHLEEEAENMPVEGFLHLEEEAENRSLERIFRNLGLAYRINPMELVYLAVATFLSYLCIRACRSQIHKCVSGQRRSMQQLMIAYSWASRRVPFEPIFEGNPNESLLVRLSKTYTTRVFKYTVLQCAFTFIDSLKNCSDLLKIISFFIICKDYTREGDSRDNQALVCSIGLLMHSMSRGKHLYALFCAGVSAKCFGREDRHKEKVLLALATILILGAYRDFFKKIETAFVKPFTRNDQLIYTKVIRYSALESSLLSFIAYSLIRYHVQRNRVFDIIGEDLLKVLLFSQHYVVANTKDFLEIFKFFC